jgi:hypothetical protein
MSAETASNPLARSARVKIASVASLMAMILATSPERSSRGQREAIRPCGQARPKSAAPIVPRHPWWRARTAAEQDGCRPFRSRRFCRPIDDSAASAPRPQNRSPAIFASVARPGTKEHIRHESSCSSTTRSPCGNGTTPLTQERALLQKSREVQAFSRFSATRLRNWMRREVSSTMTPDCTNCVNVRDTVSMVSPR